MREKLEQIKNNAISELKSSIDKENLENIRVKYLGKKGELTTILRSMGKLSAEERPIIGKLANEIRGSIETLITDASKKLKEAEKNIRLSSETIDISMPGRKQTIGNRNPLDLTLERMKEIFISIDRKSVV